MDDELVSSNINASRQKFVYLYYQEYYLTQYIQNMMINNLQISWPTIGTTKPTVDI